MLSPWLRIVCLACVFALVGLGTTGSVLAQEAGDQIVDTDQTPTPDTAADTQTDAADEPADTPDDADTANAAATPDDGAEPSERPTAADLGIVFEPGDNLVTVEELNLREEAEAEADLIEVIPEGETVVLSGDGEPVNNFLPVDYGENAGWVYLPFLVAEGEDDNLAVTTEELNLREEPNADAEVIDTLETDTDLRIVGTVTDDDDNEWNRVFIQAEEDDQEDTFGWASAEFIERVDPDATDATPAAVASTDQAADLVTVRDANLYDAATSDGGIVTVVPFGALAVVTGEAENGFVPVTVDGVAGWLSTQDIAPAEIADEITGGTADPVDSADEDGLSIGEDRLTLDEVNLRAQPSEDAEILLVLPPGSTVTLIGGFENGYVAVSVGSVTGWVLAELLVE